jgi:uncharacterized protein with HEPN domain
MSDKDRGYLLSVLDSIEKISKYIEGIRDGEGLSANTMAFDAVLMNFVKPI